MTSIRPVRIFVEHGMKKLTLRSKSQNVTSPGWWSLVVTLTSENSPVL